MKFSALTQLFTPDALDELAIVDKSDSTQGATGTTKRLTVGAFDSRYRGNRLSVSDYPAGGDDANSFNDAATAVVAAGNGSIYAPAGVYSPSARIVIPNYCNLEGDGAGQGIKTRTIPTRIICTAAGSGVTIQGRGGESHGFKVFGDGVANNPFLIDVVPAGDVGTQRSFRNIDVDGALQDNCIVYTPQNLRFWNLNLSAAGRDNLVLDKGTSGHIFSGCEIASAGRYGIHVTETGHTGGATVPGHTTFIGCIIELNTLAALCVEHMGNSLRFIGCAFAVSGGTDPLVRIDESTPGDIVAPLIFDSCQWFMIGGGTGAAAIQVNSSDTGKVKVVLTGQHYFQGNGSTPFIDSPTATVVDNSHVTLVNATYKTTGSQISLGYVSDLAANYTLVKDVSCQISTAASAGAEYLVAPGTTNAVVTAVSSASANAAASKRRLKAADYTPPSALTTKLRLSCTVSPGNGNPNATFTFYMKPVHTTAGLLVPDASVASVAITPSSGNADFEGESADFTFPTDGEYIVTCIPSAIPAVSCAVSAKIQRHAV